MSYIASFYIFDAAQSEELAALAEFEPAPQKILGLFPKKTIDTKQKFWNFIRTKTCELEEYNYSGFAFVDLLMLYPSLAAVSESELGNRIANAMGSTFITFTKQKAELAISALGAQRPVTAEILEYFEKDGRAADAEQWEMPIQAAWSIMRSWLSQVKDGKVGLLSVG